MSKEILQLQPEPVWRHFYTLTQVPRPSKHEARITKTLQEFGESLGLETLVDSVGNVIIRKPATAGFENRTGVILQAHLDMVPQKNGDLQHDFTNDPIDAYIDGDVVRARGTTLGADNGIGVAAAMAVLESKTLKHGPIETLFTIDEETGMTGANALQSGILQGKILLNLDSETEGEVYVGCAGGLDGTFRLPITWENVCSERAHYQLQIKGLKGGHSGMDIVLGRANSIKLLVRLLNHLSVCDARITHFEGGNLRNAIPREASATLAIPQKQVAAFEAGVKEMETIYRNTFAKVDDGITLTLQPCDSAPQMLTQESQERLVRTLCVLPNGVISMSHSLKGLVETSTNLAVVKLTDDRSHVVAQCLLRSSVESEKEALSEQMEALYRLAGGEALFDNGYPGWAPNMDSPILHTLRTVYAKRWGKEPAIMAIHAGLECGILGSAYPAWDMVSFGPTIMSPHSPDERVDIASVAKFWEFLQLILEATPEAGCSSACGCSVA